MYGNKAAAIALPQQSSTKHSSLQSRNVSWRMSAEGAQSKEEDAEAHPAPYEGQAKFPHSAHLYLLCLPFGGHHLHILVKPGVAHEHCDTIWKNATGFHGEVPPSTPLTLAAANVACA